MIKTLIASALTLSIVTTANASVSKDEVIDITNRLSQLTKTKINLHFDNSTAVNAWATCGNHVTVTKGAMDSLKRDEMMFVIGHEIGHIKLGHVGVEYYSPLKGVGCVNANYEFKKSESDADYFSLDVMKKGGYDACSGGAGFFHFMMREYGSEGDPTDPHTSSKFRLQQVEEYACHSNDYKL